MERREVVETLVSTGRVRSVSRTALGASMVGTVERVLVEEGDAVAAGETVIELESRELAAAAAEARARVAAAQAALRGVAAEDLRTARAELVARARCCIGSMDDVEYLGFRAPPRSRSWPGHRPGRRSGRISGRG